MNEQNRITDKCGYQWCDGPRQQYGYCWHHSEYHDLNHYKIVVKIIEAVEEIQEKLGIENRGND